MGAETLKETHLALGTVVKKICQTSAAPRRGRNGTMNGRLPAHKSGAAPNSQVVDTEP